MVGDSGVGRGIEPTLVFVICWMALVERIMKDESRSTTFSWVDWSLCEIRD